MISDKSITYFVPGLGVDQRIFKFLNLKVNQVRYIQWMDPVPSESLRSYCTRLIEQIDKERGIILVGVSFGGLVAQEIAQLLPCKKVIIISSVKSAKEFSCELRLIRFTNIHRVFSPKVLKWLNRFTANYYFGVQSISDAQLLQEIIKDTDDNFLKWAIECIMKWKPTELSYPIIHIHGTKDRIFPARYIRHAKFIDGGHFMIVNKAKELSDLINAHLS